MADPLGDSVPLTGDPCIDVVTQGGSSGVNTVRDALLAGDNLDLVQ